MATRRRVPPISEDEKREAFDQRHGLTGFAIDNTEQLLFLKCAFDTGDISTVYLNPVLACDLFLHLKRLLQDQPENAGSALRLATDVGPVQIGHVFPAR